MEKIRLQKYFTDCGIMSRRRAEREIADGRVRVNGEVATVGQTVTPGVDTVEYNGKAVIMPGGEKKICIMLNKPRGFITSLSDDRGRKCVTELLGDLSERVYPVGRLDMYSEGLLILTNDGELANALTHPRHGVAKIYHVTTEGVPSDSRMNALRAPMTIDGYSLLPVKSEIISRSPGSAVIEMHLYEGRNRQIRKMCDAVGIKIRRLKRVAIGDITLGDLEKGKYRYLSDAEIEYLRKTAKIGGNENA